MSAPTPDPGHPPPDLHLVLLRPEIPQNTGNIGRLCALVRARLHLVHPLGFTITDRHLRRSGMDYWHSLDLAEHASWEAFLQSPQRPARTWLFTTRAPGRPYWDAAFEPGDGLLFGNEGHGCPDEVHRWAEDAGRRLSIPQYDERLRSLNLSTAAGIATYEVLRQFRGRVPGR